MLDMPCAFARSVLTQWLGVLPWLQPLIEEVEARHNGQSRVFFRGSEF